VALSSIIPVLHGVYSPQKVLECARLAYGLGFKSIVISKAMGSAAQSGVPEAQKLALKLGRSLLYLADIDDVLDLLSPRAVYTVAPPPYAENVLDPGKIAREAEESRVVIVFGGSDPGLSRRELEKGTPVHPPGIEGDVGTLGLMAITLYLVAKAIQP